LSDLAFSTLPLKPALLENLSSLGYETMTNIQAQSLPDILEGKDVIAQGKTGSGKTAAFGLGLLNKLNVKRFRIQTLVLCPTRELADQVATEIRKLARAIHNIKVLTLCGGMPFGPQVGSLEHGAHIIVGTPGRVEEHVRKGNLKLDNVETLVLDEADRMLDMGFQDALDSIIEEIPGKRQTLLLSATYPKQIESIAQRYMNSPSMVKAESTHATQSITQHFYELDEHVTRVDAVQRLLMTYKPASTIIFCTTKRETQDVADILADNNFSVIALHGDMEQRDRDQTLIRFANNSASILVATDVAARGLDIKELDAVINYQIARDSDIHVHRVGRTGRAGSNGLAFTLYDQQERYRVDRLEQAFETELKPEALPDASVLGEKKFYPPMVTLQIDGGKRQKVRPGDILGALTGDNGIEGKQVGKINVIANHAYVAVDNKVAKKALNKLSQGKLKGRQFRARIIY
jgi:ATP-independent RNA helicase DbpA